MKGIWIHLLAVSLPSMVVGLETIATVTTVAGTLGDYGSFGDVVLGDGGPATNAKFRYTGDVALDSAGNLYIVDPFINAVRMVDVITSTITTVVGTIGPEGFSGDGGPATSAMMHGPFGVSIDGENNIIIADTGNNRIRKVNGATGIITTVAGSDGSGFDGDGGPATAALLYRPFKAVADSTGNIYIADTINKRIRMVDATTGIISTIAGSTPLVMPDSSYVYLGEGGPATAAQFNYPLSLALDSAGNMYLAPVEGGLILKVAASTGIISTVAGTGATGDDATGDGGPALLATFKYLTGFLSFDAEDNLYICDAASIRKVDTAGVISTVAGSPDATSRGDDGPASAAKIYYPQGIVVDRSSNLVYFTDPDTYTVRLLRLNGE